MDPEKKEEQTGQTKATENPSQDKSETVECKQGESISASEENCEKLPGKNDPIKVNGESKNLIVTNGKASDGETITGDISVEPSYKLSKNEGCCNAYCLTLSSAKLIIAQPYVLNHYGLRKSKNSQQSLVCEVCRNIVDIRNEEMAKAMKENKFVFCMEAHPIDDSEEDKPSTIEITISDSDSSDEGDPNEQNLTPEAVAMVNKNLEKFIDMALEKYGLGSQIDKGIREANAVLDKSKIVIKEVISVQEDAARRADVLQDTFYKTFSNREAIYKNAVEIVDLMGPEGGNQRPPDRVDSEPTAGSVTGTSTKGVAMKRVTQMPRNSGPSAETHPPAHWAALDVSLVKQVHITNRSVPPIGSLPRPPLKSGDMAYVMKNGIFGIWVQGQIEEIIPKGRPVRLARPAASTELTSCVSYRMKFQFLGKAFSMKTVNGKQIAYSEPSAFRYPVGTRVIAIYRDVDVPPGSYYAGIVAEPPKEVNKYRYLIFFDDGYTQYVVHSSILLVVEASKNVYEDVDVGSRDFIKQYLENFPERPMLKLSVDQVIKTEWNGKWWLAKVFELDCSLCNMSFLADSRTEWMYRGSTRLSPLFKLHANEVDGDAEAALAAIENARPIKKQKLVGTPISTLLSQAQYGQKTDPFTGSPLSSPGFTFNSANLDMEDSSSLPMSLSPSSSSVPMSPLISSLSMSLSPSTSSVVSSPVSVVAVPVPGASRSVAKKSTSARPAYMSAANTIGNYAMTPQSKYYNQVPGYIKHDMYASAIKIQPKKFEPHQCGPTCISWIHYVPEHTKHCGPLTVPILHGWQRQLIKYRNKKAINYRSPCGRRIRNTDELSRYLRITKSLMGVDFFDFNYWVSCLSEFVVQRSYLNIKDLSDGKENMQIPCVNYIDHSYPDVMDYSAMRQPVPGVQVNLDEEFLTGCDCTDGCSNKDKCACWQLTFAGTDYGQSGVVDNSIGYSHKRLNEPVLTGIYECNSRCKCSSTCANRVVQNPLRAKLQVFKTPNKGWGIRSISDMPQGSFICIYAGRLLNEHEANEGGKECGDEYLAELDYIEVVERLKEGYEEQVKELFGESEEISKKEKEADTDENSDKGKGSKEFESKVEPESDENLNLQLSVKSRLRTRRGTTKDIPRKTAVKDTTKRRKRKQNKKTGISEDDDSNEPAKQLPRDISKPLKSKSVRYYFNEPDMCYIMDAKVSGNIGRYLNHSCMPNVFVQNVFVDTHDLRFPWVAFFALTFIRAGTELTWDYNYDIGSVPNKTLLCRCESVECRGRLL